MSRTVSPTSASTRLTRQGKPGFSSTVMRTIPRERRSASQSEKSGAKRSAGSAQSRKEGMGKCRGTRELAESEPMRDAGLHVESVEDRAHEVKAAVSSLIGPRINKRDAVVDAYREVSLVDQVDADTDAD